MHPVTPDEIVDRPVHPSKGVRVGAPPPPSISNRQTYEDRDPPLRPEHPAG